MPIFSLRGGFFNFFTTPKEKNKKTGGYKNIEKQGTVSVAKSRRNFLLKKTVKGEAKREKK